MSGVLMEEYIVRFRYQTHEGYWRTKDEMVVVPLRGSLAKQEKKNHAAAEAKLLVKYPGALITSVTYV